jgi:hypothetical protein
MDLVSLLSFLTTVGHRFSDVLIKHSDLLSEDSGRPLAFLLPGVENCLEAFALSSRGQTKEFLTKDPSLKCAGMVGLGKVFELGQILLQIL